jgi:hypothetical protein
MLYASRTILIHTKCGTIKVVPIGNKRLGVKAPGHVKITDGKGKPLTSKRPGA